MAAAPTSRNRHGRGLRRPIPSKLFRHGVQRSSYFQQIVSETCEYLTDSFSAELGNLKWRIEEVPFLREGEALKRWTADKNSMTITLYRIPIERLGKRRFPDPRLHIEQAVLAAAAALIDKDPWELVHPN